MGRSTFLPSLIEFDKDHIPPSRLKKAQKYVDKPDFEPDAVGKKSEAARPLCMWVRAMYEYIGIAKFVQPKLAALRQAESELRVANRKLAEKEAQRRAKERAKEAEVAAGGVAGQFFHHSHLARDFKLGQILSTLANGFWVSLLCD